MISSTTHVRTPCIGVCSTGIGDLVCRGCKRFSHEIIDWNSYDEAQRQAVVNRLDLLLAQVVSHKLTIVDSAKLESQLRLHGIRYNASAPALCWVFTFLKAGASQITALEPYGVRALPDWSTLSATELRDQIDTDFYALSCAHFQRYFQL